MELLRILLCGITIGSLTGCNPPNTQKHTYEALVFTVDQTRLEPAITDSMLNIQVSAPKGWKAIDDVMLMQVVDELGDKLAQGLLQIVPRWVFVNEGSQAMCVVSRLKAREVPDETLLKTLETAYRSQFPKATVLATIFMKDAFCVHQLMISASDFVLIKLICNAPENPVFEVDYVVPREVYEIELRAIESSISSINLITNSP